MHAAGAACLLFNIGPIKFFICGVVTVVAVVDSKLPSTLSDYVFVFKSIFSGLLLLL